MAIHHKISRALMFPVGRLTRLWRRFFLPPCYVLVYDDEHRGTEEYYGYFSSPQEAREVWDRFTNCLNGLHSPETQRFANIKLCRVVENWA